MTENEKEYARWCVLHDPHKFYKWRKWLRVRREVLELDRFECQRCRNIYHRYCKATTVHHVNPLKERPELSLEIWYRDPATHKERRNLLSLCHNCHEEVHGYRKRDSIEPLTQERWD
jgi:5-methylcytosine-specific restriction endonuclease McrA